MTEEPCSLSAIVLCYRAGVSIRKLLGALECLLEESGVDFELVLVANYWPDKGDDTPAIVREFAAGRPRAVVVSEAKKGGMGWDMRTGLAAAHGDYLVLIDGDAQNPVEDVLRMYDLLVATGADLGKGRRTNRADGRWRRFVSSGYNTLFRLMFGTWDLWDVNGKPKGIRRSAYQQLHLESNDWFADAELVLAARRAGMTVAELPVIFLENKERSSFVRPSSMLEFGFHMIRYRIRGRP